MLIFWSFKESRVNTKLLRMCSTNLGLDTCGSGLHSVWYKESLWKCSVGTNRNVVCLCGFLSPPAPFFPQRQVLWWKDICAFFFLFKTECHDLGHTNVISTLTACWFISCTCFRRKERQDFKGTFWGQSWHLTWYIPQEQGKQKHSFNTGDLNNRETHLQLDLHINTWLVSFLVIFFFYLNHKMKR